MPPFLDMLDDLTPYYQAKMRSLSPQQRSLVDFLSGAQGALPVKEIARRALMGATPAANQLKLLREMGYVRIAHSKGRETYYELKEPLMRLCLGVKKQREGPIQLFVEFLRVWCPREELERRLAALPSEAPFTSAALREALRLSATGKTLWLKPAARTMHGIWNRAIRNEPGECWKSGGLLRDQTLLPLSYRPPRLNGVTLISD